MKNMLLLLISATIFASCSSPANKNDKTDTIMAGDTLAKSKDTKITNNTPTISSLCFLNTEKKDSTSIELVIKGDKVTGTMNWLPYQKDSSKGTLDGVVKDSLINATWTFMQEGVKDTLNLNFRITNNKLLQKPLKLNAKTGLQQTDAASAYSVVYRTEENLHK